MDPLSDRLSPRVPVPDGGKRLNGRCRANPHGALCYRREEPIVRSLITPLAGERKSHHEVPILVCELTEGGLYESSGQRKTKA